MHTLLLRAAAILAAAAPLAAHAAPAATSDGLTWTSAPLFIGQVHGHTAWVPMIQSMQADANGLYEMFYQTKTYSQESYADHKAIATRADCNRTHSNACVVSRADWQQVTEALTFVTK